MVNSRWLNLKNFIFGLSLFVSLISCTNQKMNLNPMLTMTSSPSATFTVVSTSTENSFVPKETPKSFTPVAFDPNIQDISQVIDTIYNVPLACKLDWLNPSQNPSPYNATPDLNKPAKKLDFIDITELVDLQKIWVHEIVEATNNKYRAYLVDEPAPESCDTCIKSAVYVEDLKSKHIYRLDFEGYMPNRVLYGLSWVGANVVVFAQNESPFYDDLFGINVETESYVYVASFTRCSNSN